MARTLNDLLHITLMYTKIYVLDENYACKSQYIRQHTHIYKYRKQNKNGI